MKAAQPTKGFSVSDVRLVRCAFSRLKPEDRDGARSVKSTITPSAPTAIVGGISFSMDLVVRAQGFLDETPMWVCETVFGAIFNVEPGADVTPDDVAAVHGPALLYGFAREHVFDLARRAGINGAFLPPLNFMKSNDG